MHSYRFQATDIVWSTDSNRVRNPRKQGLVRLGRGCFIPATLLDDEEPLWWLTKQVQVARAMAVVTSPNSRDERYLTMESALELRGLPTWRQIGPIEYRSIHSTGSRSSLRLHQVKVRGRQVPEVSTRRLLGVRTGTSLVNVLQTPTATLQEVAVDLALSANAISAYVGVSVVLSELARFDPFELARSRQREERARSSLVQRLERLAGTRGARRAAQILELADGSIESPPEGAVLWLLHVLLRRCRSKKAQFQSQFWVETELGFYRLDVAFPILRFYLEFDGRGKLITDDDSAEKWQMRQAGLLEEGWHCFRISSRDLKDLPNLATKLSEKLSQFGIRPAPLG